MGRIMRLYFAHPKINNRKSRKIIKILEERGYEVIDPLNRNFISYDEIVDRDVDLLDSCDVVFVWIPKKRKHRNIGTSIEMYWGHLMEKYIMVLSYKNNPFIKHYADVIYLSFRGFKNHNFVIETFI